jgi:hypothetical protein
MENRAVELADPLDRRSRAHLDALGDDGMIEQMEKARSVDAEAEGVRAPLRVAHPHGGAAGKVAAFQPLDARAARLRRVKQTERPQRRHAGGLQEEAGAERPRRFESFEEGDPMALAMQGQRRG